MRYKSYKDLIVWQKSMDLTQNVYDYTELLPKEELFGLSSQMRRCALSIPSNIAEGYGRCSDKEFIRFLYIASGSLAELETQMLLAVRLKYYNEEQLQALFDLCKEIGKLLNALIARIKNEEIGLKED
ncbi:MAG: four helix bundle protein [Clostridia bacterium]|nr:four helix bundle protein [Clostridia bacterium]